MSDVPNTRRIALAAAVDTGFDGGLLVPLDRYLELGLQRYEDPGGTFSARAASGVTVSLRSSKGVVGLGDRRLDAGVFTTPFLVRPIVGREVINRLLMVLDGPKRELRVDGGGLNR